ncbi:unnamed protein product, partial [marine sediment metagenome]
VTFCEDAYHAAEGGDLLVILTEWNQFRKLDFGRLKKALTSPRIVDCRNIYDSKAMADAGFEYICVGR